MTRRATRCSGRAKRVGLLLLAIVGACGAAARAGDLRVHRTKYYELHTDLEGDALREAKLRVTLMAEEYHRRTKDFAGELHKALPFFLYSEAKDYYLAGGKPGSAGVFVGDRLMAIADPDRPAAMWHTIQHEGFHQFVFFAIGEKVPTWANEGMAEYFGEGVFTGDDFQTGGVPPQRLLRVQRAIRDHKYKLLREMMVMPQENWNSDFTLENYDQAWSMVHFLAHAENGKYQRAFGAFLTDVSRGQDWQAAWTRNFGRDVSAFQERWETYWSSLDEASCKPFYAEAVTATLTSFFARGLSQRQDWETFDQYLATAADGSVKMNEEDWLPARLCKEAAAIAPKVGAWSLEKRSGKRLVVCTLDDGTRLEGSHILRGSRIKSVKVEPKNAKRK